MGGVEGGLYTRGFARMGDVRTGVTCVLPRCGDVARRLLNLYKPLMGSLFLLGVSRMVREGPLVRHLCEREAETAIIGQEEIRQGRGEDLRLDSTH